MDKPQASSTLVGPKGFTNTFHEFELKPGGTWRYDMHGPNGVTYPNHSVFVEIVPLERIVINHLSSPEFQITATFTELEERTLVTFRQSFKKTEEFVKAKTCCVEGNEQNLDRLGELLSEISD